MKSRLRNYPQNQSTIKKRLARGKIRFNDLIIQKKKAKEELERVKKERNETNSLLYQTIEKYDKNIETLKQNFDKEITELKKREEEYLHSNANLLESDIFTVYKEIQEKFEHKLKENVSLKGQNDKMCI